MSQRLSTHSTPSTYTEGEKRGGIQSGALNAGGGMCLASIHRVAKLRGCCGLACAFTATAAKMPGPRAGALRMMS